ncbi:MAG: hypothetical protein N3D16_04680 [Anaerolineales bacterium]|nr:hypothetical protein [Anaerolineales bacterium]
MNLTLLRVLALIGSFVTLAFGVWHSVVPWLYGWFDYLPSAPDELINAIVATNFFLAVALVLLGALTAIVTIWQWHNLPTVRLTLWIMSILWITRVGYQMVKPQGKMIPGLSIIMLAIFTFTAICFLVPSLLLREK